MSSNKIDFNASSETIKFVETGKPEELKVETVTENGEYEIEPSSGHSISKVELTVEVTPPLQGKSVPPVINTTLTVAPDENYYGLHSVSIQGASLVEESFIPSTSEQTFIAGGEGEDDGWNKVIIEAVDSSIDSNIVAENIKSGVSILGVTGTLTPDVPSVVERLEVTPSTEPMSYVPRAGVDGFKPVVVAAVDSSIDSNIIPENIAEGVEILGVTGTHSGGGDYDEVYEALEDLNTGNVTIPGAKNNFDGSVDVEGLTAIGWTSDDIQYLKDNIWWYSWENDNYKVSQFEKDLYDNGNFSDTIMFSYDKSYLNSIRFMPVYQRTRSNFSASYFSYLTNLLALPCISITDYAMPQNCKDFSDTFNGCTSLKLVPPMDTSTIKYTFSCFKNCKNLDRIPKLNFENATGMNEVFDGCSRIESIPAINTSKSTEFYFTFHNCIRLTGVPLIDTSKGTNFCGIFQGCSVLPTIPSLDTSAGTNFSYMFYGCNVLSSVPHFNTSNGTDFSYMFYNCKVLTSVPNLDTSSGTTFSNMFYGCTKLESIPELDTSSGTNFQNMFNACNTLEVIPELDTSKGTSLSSMFLNCPSLKTIEGIDFSGLTSNQTSATYMFSSTNNNIESITVNGYINYTLNFTNLKKIDYDSVKSILSAASRTTNTNSKTLTFSRTMTDQEGELASLVSQCTSKGWTITGLTIN